MIERDLLRSALLKKHYKMEDLAKFLNVTESTLSKKVGESRFTLKEVKAVSDWLGLTIEEKNAIFLG